MSIVLPMDGLPSLEASYTCTISGAWGKLLSAKMTEETLRSDSPSEPGSTGPEVRPLVSGRDWWITEQVCCAGPSDRPFEERHERAAIALVISGSFQYHADTGQSMLYPGALMLGNPGTCFECGHEHGTGDHCVAVHYAPSLFEEIASFAGVARRRMFPVPMLPNLRSLASLAVRLRMIRGGTDAAFAEEVAMQTAERVLSMIATAGARSQFAPAATRRLSDVLRYIEENVTLPIGLQDMADVCGLSKYHFLRAFTRNLGVTPYEYLINLRLTAAASALLQSRAPVSQIAFDVGFGDLSTFNARFRDVFRSTPSEYRRAYTTR